MKSRSFAVRYLLGTAFWCAAFYLNYTTAKHSILPIADALWLPNLVVPASLAVLSIGFLLAALTVKPRAELFDVRATLEVRAPTIVRLTRFAFSVALIVSGFIAFTGRPRPDLAYSTPGWGLFWLIGGVWSLISVAFVLRNRVEISPSGVRQPQVRPSLIPWSDVGEVKVQRWLLSRFVLLKFREGTEYRLAALPWRWRKVRRIMFLPVYFGVDAATLANTLSMRRDMHAF